MLGYIDGIDFKELEAMKYFAPPASWSEEKRRTNAIDKIFSGDWYGARKMDGFFAKFVKDEDGNMMLFSRSRGVDGQFANKFEWVPQLHPLFEELPNGTCLLGELYLPSKPGSRNVQTIMGCLKDKAIARQEKGEKINFYIFDVLADNGKSWLRTPAADRFDALNEYARAYGEATYWQWARYFTGEELWNKLQIILNTGGEGMVITHKDAIYEPGKRPSKTTLKIKMELRQTIDCVVLGANEPTYMYTGKDVDSWEYWFDHALNKPLERGNHSSEALHGAPIDPVTKAYWNGWAGSIKIGLWKDGRLVQIGSISGVTEEILQNWRDYVGRVCEVTAMEITPDKALRHPKFLGWRDDKTSEECGWEQLEQ